MYASIHLPSAGINEGITITVLRTDGLIVGELDKLGHGKRLRHSFELINSVKRFGGLLGALPKPFGLCCRCGEVEEMFGLGLPALRIDDDSLEFRDILNKRTGIDHGKVDVEWRMLLKQLCCFSPTPYAAKRDEAVRLGAGNAKGFVQVTFVIPGLSRKRKLLAVR